MGKEKITDKPTGLTVRQSVRRAVGVLDPERVRASLQRYTEAVRHDYFVGRYNRGLGSKSKRPLTRAV